MSKLLKGKKKNLSKLSGPKEQFEYLKRNLPSAFEGRSIEFIVKDMSEGVDELPSNHFDLAYCERVLYRSVPDSQKIQSAINEMARVVKPGARVIAVEAALDDFGNPIDFHPLFIKAGLIEEYLKDAPENAYCYKKPLYSS